MSFDSDSQDTIIQKYIAADFLQRKELEKQYKYLKSTNFYQEINMQQIDAEIHYDISDYTSVVHLHSHSFYEIVFCNGGNVQYMLGNDRYQVQKGDVILIAPGVSHRPLFIENNEEPYERYALWLNADFFRNAMEKYPELDFAFRQCEKRDCFLLRTTPATWSGLNSGFHSIWLESKNKKIGWQAIVSASALALMAHISRTLYYMDIAIPPLKQNTMIEEIYRYIDLHLAEKISLEDVANQFFVSKSSISHAFRKQLGVSFYQCVIQRRLIAAKNLILQGTPLKIVWQQCGFADYSSFYRLFKKEYEISPEQFRTLHQKKN